jgi:hypothetical protein
MVPPARSAEGTVGGVPQSTSFSNRRGRVSDFVRRTSVLGVVVHRGGRRMIRRVEYAQRIWRCVSTELQEVT